MAVSNIDIADILDRYADLLAIDGANPFRVRSYRDTARMLRETTHSMAEQVAAGRDLTEIAGIGKVLAGKITTIVTTGALPQLAALEARVPGGLTDLLQLPGMGPKRVRLVHDALGVRGLDDFKRVPSAGKLDRLGGFGSKTVARIKAALEEHRTPR